MRTHTTPADRGDPSRVIPATRSASSGGTHRLAPLSFRGATYSGVFTLLPLITGTGREHHGEILAEIVTLADAGHLTPRLDPRTFKFETVHEAHLAVEQGTTQGKVVVEL